MRNKIWGIIAAAFAAVCMFGTQYVYAEQTQAVAYSEAFFDDEEELVEYLNEGILAHEESLTFIMSSDMYEGMSARDKFSEVLDMVAMYYETSGLSMSYSGVSNGTEFTIYPHYKYTLEQDRAMNVAIDNAIKSLNLNGKSEYQKVRAIHDYICDKVDYDDEYEKYTAYDAIMTGSAVCQGYANLFCRMCYEVDLEVELITGIGNGGGHAWNIVKIGDVYYNIDVTWDGQGTDTGHTYFLKSPNEFSGHSRSDIYETQEYHKEHPMANDSWVDFSDVSNAMGLSNISKVYFNTIDGGTVSNIAENNRPKILIFGSTNGCTNTSTTLREIAGANFKDVDVVLIDADMATLATVQEFKSKYGNGNSSIKYSYSESSSNLSVMWNYVHAAGIDMKYFPLVVFIDGNNTIQRMDYSSPLSAVYVRNIANSYLINKKVTAISATKVTVNAKESVGIYAEVYGVRRNGQFVTWSSSDTSVATVDANGIITGVQKGTATITCKINNEISHKCTVTVNRAKIADGFNLGYDGQWAYYKNGVVDTSYTGMACNAYGWWYVKNGVLDRTFTGMAKNSAGWWYMKDGKLDRTYTGFVKNAYGYWFFKDGKLNKTYVGLVKNSSGLWYVKDGKIDWSYTGMAAYGGKWLYIKSGKYDATFTGMAYNSAGWWYMKNGVLDRTYTGLAKNSYGTWYMKEGKLDRTFSGKVTFGGKTYTVKNGKVV